jgi:dolichol-phosphate mannosyltransferase
MRAVVVVPTYNERQNVAELVARIRRVAPNLHILIVDDNSPDGTGGIVSQLAEHHAGHLFLLSRPGKGGLAKAYVAGFQAALAKGYDVILQMDADLSHDPCYIPIFLERIARCDLVLGSRYMRGINVVNWDFKRLILSKLASVYVRMITGMPFSDATGGFKCWKGSTLEQIDFIRVFSNGYLFQVEMTWKAYRKGCRIEETPIIFYERELGRSKINWRIIIEAIWGVLTLRFRR